ncbi:MAG: alpha/beta hydrolase [Ruminococcaceae bacterium]|nr:alpha/beta hydrolase [Oscillospiraceae bacterium]
MTKKTIAGIAAAGGIIATSVLISHVTTRHLVKVAIDRKEPKTVKTLKKHLTRSPRTKELLATMQERASRLQEIASETVEIASHDGQTLIGHWYGNPNARRVILAMHGWRSSWSQDFGLIYEFFHNHGCSVLYAEQRGQNNSGGAYMTFGVLEQYDCLDWIHWINRRTDSALPIYLCGVSMGASTVLMASGQELPQNVHGIIADCGFTSPHAIWRHVVKENLHLPYGFRGYTINRIIKRRLNTDAREYSTVQALEKNTVPVFFAHGGADHFVPLEMTFENYRACRAEKRLLIVPDAIHGLSYYYDQKRYEAALLDFFKDFD